MAEKVSRVQRAAQAGEAAGSALYRAVTAEYPPARAAHLMNAYDHFERGKQIILQEMAALNAQWAKQVPLVDSDKPALPSGAPVMQEIISHVVPEDVDVVAVQ